MAPTLRAGEKLRKTNNGNPTTKNLQSKRPTMAETTKQKKASNCKTNMLIQGNKVMPNKNETITKQMAAEHDK